MGKAVKGGVKGSVLDSLSGSVAGGLGGVAGLLFGLGRGGSAGPKLDMSRFDYKKDIDERTKPSREASLKLLTQLEEQAEGRGPSLADAQLRSATSRNLAQTLAAAAASRGGSPALQQRELMRTQTETGRQLAEQSALAKMQEQLSAREQLANLAIQQQGQDLAQVAGYAAPMQNFEQLRFEQDVARRNQVRSQQSALRGQLLNAGATLLAGGLGGPAAAGGGTANTRMQGGGQYVTDRFLAKGGRVPGVAVESGDDYANDVVHAALSPGEIVLPRSVATKKDAPNRAKQFVEALMQQERKEKPKTNNKLANLLQQLAVPSQPTTTPDLIGFAQVLAEMKAAKKKGQ